jgi:hemerythrin-like domain-containing protein
MCKQSELMSEKMGSTDLAMHKHQELVNNIPILFEQLNDLKQEKVSMNELGKLKSYIQVNYA